jgi:hypothetical protein
MPERQLQHAGPLRPQHGRVRSDGRRAAPRGFGGLAGFYGAGVVAGVALGRRAVGVCARGRGRLPGPQRQAPAPRPLPRGAAPLSAPRPRPEPYHAALHPQERAGSRTAPQGPPDRCLPSRRAAPRARHHAAHTGGRYLGIPQGARAQRLRARGCAGGAPRGAARRGAPATAGSRARGGAVSRRRAERRRGGGVATSTGAAPRAPTPANSPGTAAAPLRSVHPAGSAERAGAAPAPAAVSRPLRSRAAWPRAAASLAAAAAAPRRRCPHFPTPQGSAVQKLSDWALAVAIPVHMHISTNACVTDYVPTRFRGEQDRACGGGVVTTAAGPQRSLRAVPARSPRPQPTHPHPPAPPCHHRSPRARCGAGRQRDRLHGHHEGQPYGAGAYRDSARAVAQAEARRGGGGGRGQVTGAAPATRPA